LRITPVASAHRLELASFTAQLDDDGTHFSAMTYQELFARMLPVVGPEDATYMAYLRDRSDKRVAET
jgi:hypothetical protein